MQGAAGRGSLRRLNVLALSLDSNTVYRNNKKKIKQTNQGIIIKALITAVPGYNTSKRELRIRHFLRDIPGMDCQDQVNREKKTITADLSLIPEKPDCGSDVDLKYHDSPPFTEVSISKTRKHKIQKTCDEGIFPIPRSPA